MNQNRSVATIDAPQFINIVPYNPLISQCEIKVLYLGKNRNGSFIDKNTAIQMANSLPGTPIVAAYNESKEDFGDHGEKIVIEDGEIKFSCKTIPYGFVAPDAEVWFQKFEDTDEFDNKIIREYLMTTGYLWTGQFEELQSVIEQGKGQSMELDPEKLKGHWATDNNTGVEFFIINDAIFSKLCILGDDVEPCFEGASVTAPDVSKNFTQDKGFAKTLYSMMNELQFALNKGGSDMTKEAIASTEFAVEGSAEDAPTVEGTDFAQQGKEDFKKDEDSKRKCEKVDEEDKKPEKEEKSEDTKDEDPKPEDKPEEDEKKPATKSTIESDEVSIENLQSELSELRSNYSMLESELEELRSYKTAVEDEKKDAMIAKFYMLSDEDKKDVISNKSQYTLEQIEEKLSVICVRNKVSFELDSEADEAKDDSSNPITTFNLDGAVESVPGWVQAIRAAKNN